MIRKKIYLVRHGQTDYNLKGVVQGSGIDAPINENGRNQAIAFFEAYKTIPFDQAYYSGLQRTKQSIQSFLDLAIPAISTTDLNEISWGDYEGLPMTNEENQYYLHMLDQWRQGNLDYSIAGGESPNLVAKRMQRGIDAILNGPGDTILVCMHGRAMRIFLSLILKKDLRHMDEFEHKNLCLYLLEENEDGHFYLLRRNDTTHLKELR